jgi:hypothetical protein
VLTRATKRIRFRKLRRRHHAAPPPSPPQVVDAGRAIGRCLMLYDIQNAVQRRYVARVAEFGPARFRGRRIR